MKFVDVILPLPLSAAYTYALPEEQQAAVRPGCRLSCRLEPKKFYTAIVVDVHGRQPQGYAVKTVWRYLIRIPFYFRCSWIFWRWLADYYLCAVGDVYKAALPSGMKLESESKVVVNSEYAGNAVLSEREQRVVTWVLRRSESTVTQLQKECEDFRVLRVVRSLMDKGVLAMKEEVKRSYKPRTEVHVRLSETYFDEDKLHELLDGLEEHPNNSPFY